MSNSPIEVNRRTLIKTAAGAGVVAATIGVVGIAHATGSSGDAPSVFAGAPLGLTEAAATTGPLVVHVTDLHAGMVEVFTDGARTSVHDPDLANRIARAAGNR